MCWWGKGEVSLIDLSFTSIRQVKEGQIFQSLMKASTSWGLCQDAQWIGSGWWSALGEAVVLLIWICDMAVYLLLHNPWNVSQKAAQLIFSALLLFGYDASNRFWKRSLFKSIESVKTYSERFSLHFFSISKETTICFWQQVPTKRIGVAQLLSATNETAGFPEWIPYVEPVTYVESLFRGMQWFFLTFPKEWRKPYKH